MTFRSLTQLIETILSSNIGMWFSCSRHIDGALNLSTVLLDTNEKDAREGTLREMSHCKE